MTAAATVCPGCRNGHTEEVVNTMFKEPTAAMRNRLNQNVHIYCPICGKLHTTTLLALLEGAVG